MSNLIRKYVMCSDKREFRATVIRFLRDGYISKVECDAILKAFEKADFSKFCYMLCVWRYKSEDWCSGAPLEIPREKWDEAMAEIRRIKEERGYDTDIPNFITGYDFLHNAKKRKRWENIITDFTEYKGGQ